MPSKTSPKPKKTTTATRKHKPAAQRAVKKTATAVAAPVQPARTDLDLEHFRTLLYEERERLEEELEMVRSSATDVENAIPEEGEGGGEEDTADMASTLMDKEMNLSVEEEIDEMLEQIDHALVKMDEGNYGICDISGKPIRQSRLEAIPWASLTVECQALAEGD